MVVIKALYNIAFTSLIGVRFIESDSTGGRNEEECMAWAGEEEMLGGAEHQV